LFFSKYNSLFNLKKEKKMKKVLALFILVLMFAFGTDTFSQVIKMSQGFEGAAFPPAGWTSVSVLGPKVWTRETTTMTNLFPPFPNGSYVAAIDYETAGGDDYLITQKINGIVAGDSLVFWWVKRYSDGPYPPDSCIVRVSTSDSLVAHFTNVLTRICVHCTPVGTQVWNRVTLPLTPFAGQNIYIGFEHKDVDGHGMGLDSVFVVGPNAPPTSIPDLFYYKMKNVTGMTTPNFATTPPAGSNPATLIGHSFGPGGQFDSCIVGASGSGTTNNLSTTWAPNIGNGSYTISFWIGGNMLNPGTSACYLFGDVNTASWRCFYAGAGILTDTAILYRKTSMTDLRIPLVNISSNSSFVITIVYDSTTSGLTAYRNGVSVATGTWTAPAITGTGPFTISGYDGSSNSLITGMKMDEFRFYRRALSSTEVAATWNQNLGIITGITPVTSQIPNTYSLSQNYPNPFNPVTKINYELPKSGLVTLKIYDVLGKEIASLVNEVKNAGRYTVDFNGSSFSSGTYFYRLESNGFVSTKKMLLVK
jgi:hypothetical protein